MNSRRIYQLALAFFTLGALSLGANPYATSGIVVLLLLFDVFIFWSKKESNGLNSSVNRVKNAIRFERTHGTLTRNSMLISQSFL